MILSLLKYLGTIILTTIAGGGLGSLFGILSFRSDELSFGACEGLAGGLFAGLCWGVLFAWVPMTQGYLRSLRGMIFAVSAAAIVPAILGNPPLTLLAGMAGSFFFLPLCRRKDGNQG